MEWLLLPLALMMAQTQGDPRGAAPPAAADASCANCAPLGPKEVRIDNRTTAGAAKGSKENAAAAGFPPGLVTPVAIGSAGITVVDFEDGVRGCRYDLHIVFADGRSFTRRDVNVCGTDRIVITDADLTAGN